MAEPNVVSTHSLHIPPRKGVDEPAIVASISIRTGATPELIVHTLDHFRQAVIALWHGFRPADEIWGKRSTCGVENSTGEALVLIWSNEVFMLLPNGKRKKVSINKFHEKTTALECVMQMEMAQNAINEFHKLVLAANEGEKPATLQPERDKAYPVPTIVERKGLRIALQNGELPTMQAAVASRKRHNPFAIDESIESHDLVDTFGDR